jgi:hypothetical protein
MSGDGLGRTSLAFVLMCLPGVTLIDAADAPRISEIESKILVYLTPDAQQVRSLGREVFISRSEASNLNWSDFWYWEVTDPSSPAIGTNFVALFAVNVHTGAVFKPVPDEVTGEELAGVQKILRRAHGIGRKALAAHKDDLFFLPN